MIPARQSWPPELAEHYRRSGYWAGETIGEVLRRSASRSPDHTAVAGADVRWSYRELDARADAIASGLLALGIRPGERVVVHLPNIPELVGVACGAIRAGVVPVFALPAHRGAEVQHFAAAAEAVAYVTVDRHDGFDYRTIADTLVLEQPAVRNVIITGDAGGRDSDRYTTLDAVERRGRESGTSVEAAPQSHDVALMQLSGGSTGMSKLIPRTHDDYLYSVRRSVEICGFDEGTVYLGVIPIAHNFPMSSPGWLGVLYAGSTLVLSPSPSPDVAFPIIEKEGVTVTALVPPVALAWLDAVATTRSDLSSLGLIQVGGARLLAEVARRIEPAFGARLQQVFGMAEGLVNYTRLEDGDEVVVNTQGRPMSPDDEVRIVDDHGNPVPDGSPGHLHTRGPYTIRAYHNAPAANARAFTEDGFYITGDIVSRRPDGNLVVEGRATDQINRGGEKVSPDEVEDHLLAHPQVHDVALVSVADAWLGEKTCAVVVPKGAAPRAAELRAWIRARGLAAYKVPDRVVFLDAFPTTGVGKVSRRQLRAELREMLREGAPAGSAGSLTGSHA